MSKKAGMPKPSERAKRRVFTEEFCREAVQMMLDGHSASSVAERLGLSGTNLLYRWKQEHLEHSGPLATSLEARVGDITYVPMSGGEFIYMAIFMDRYSRNIVGWELAETMTDELTLDALRIAIRDRQPTTQLVHHTDRGGQYARNRYRAVLLRADMLQSMSRADNVYDNAFMESCFSRLKTELEMTEYENQQSARRVHRLLSPRTQALGPRLPRAQPIRTASIVRVHLSVKSAAPHLIKDGGKYSFESSLRPTLPNGS
jgi:transposase InsO family protein